MQLALISHLSQNETTLALGLGFMITASVVFLVIRMMDQSDRERSEDAEILKLSDRARAASGDGAGYGPKDTFHLDGKEWAATGYGTVSGFVVEKGSIVRKEAFPSLTDKLHNLRKSFVDNGILVDETAGDEMVLRVDFEFDSSTAAASFVTGRKASGPYNWKDASGLTFGQYTDRGITSA